MFVPYKNLERIDARQEQEYPLKPPINSEPQEDKKQQLLIWTQTQYPELIMNHKKFHCYASQSASMKKVVNEIPNIRKMYKKENTKYTSHAVIVYKRKYI